MAEALTAAFKAARRPEPIPFERAWKNRNGMPEVGLIESLAAEGAPAPADEVHEPSSVTGFESSLRAVVQARQIIHQLDPLGVGARDLRECLLLQISAQQREAQLAMMRRRRYNGDAAEEAVAEVVDTTNEFDVFMTANHIVAHCLALLQKKDMRELTKSCGRSADEVQEAVEYIRTLDPRPGQRYNVSETRLIEPDVAFVKRDGEYVVLMNEEDMPTLRLNQGYRKMLKQKQTEKDVREYVKALKPMMIKEVAEEIGVHPSTVSRAVANKYVHTAQGVYELRFFFSEGVNGPEGGDLPLVLLKRKVKKLIEEEDPRKPLTDDHLAAELKAQGINVTRRTVAKYREDMQIPSTHQRRVR
jgi:RNA polymerase sigma-54 factor